MKMRKNKIIQTGAKLFDKTITTTFILTFFQFVAEAILSEENIYQRRTPPQPTLPVLDPF